MKADGVERPILGGNHRRERWHQASGERVDLALDGVPQDTEGAGIDTLSDIENVEGGALNDFLSGNNGGNVIRGLVGNDVLHGSALSLVRSNPLADGNDTINGGPGNDDIPRRGDGEDSRSA